MDNSELPAADGFHHQSDNQHTAAAPPPPQPQLPPGFRFHPTDEELVVHYLKRRVESIPLPVSIIAEVDLYKFDPWELPEKAVFGEEEWYFFSPRDRKYPNGARPNRAATSGYWKATGTDKPVISSGGKQKVGVKKALVFYGGKPPRGIKTNWIMHEYRLLDNNKPNHNKPPCFDLSFNSNKKGSLRLDDWVLCRIYKKNNINRPMDHHVQEDSMDDMLMVGPMSMSLSSSINNLGHQNQLSATHGSLNYSTLLDNQHSSTIFDAHGMDPTSSTNLLPFKRPLPSLFWGTNDVVDDTNVGDIGNPSKRMSLPQVNIQNNNESSEESGVRNNDELGNNINNSLTSMSSLLSQLPSQTPPVAGPAVLDGMFRQSYPSSLSGFNWYS